MPQLNGTGPMGAGPGTGRGFGPCGAQNGRGRGFGQGGCGRGFGAGRRFYASSNNLASLQESEKFLSDELKAVQEEIKNLDKGQK